MQRVQLSVRALRPALQRSPLCDLGVAGAASDASGDESDEFKDEEEPAPPEPPDRGARARGGGAPLPPLAPWPPLPPPMPPLPKEAPPALPPLPPLPASPPLDENHNKPKGGVIWDDDMGLESLGDALNREKELIARWDMADLVVLSDLKDDVEAASPSRKPPATPEPPGWPRSGSDSRSAKGSGTSACSRSGSRKRSRSTSRSKRCSRSRSRSRCRKRSASPSPTRRRSRSRSRRRSRSRSRRRSPVGSSDGRRGRRRRRRRRRSSSSSSRSLSRSRSRSRSRLSSPSPSRSRGPGRGWRGARGRGRSRHRSGDSRGRRSRSRSTCIVSRSVVDVKRGRGAAPSARGGRGDLLRVAVAAVAAVAAPARSRSPPSQSSSRSPPSLPSTRPSSAEGTTGFTMQNDADTVEEFDLQDRLVKGAWRKSGGRRPTPCKMCMNHGLLRMFVGAHRAHCRYLGCACDLCVESRRRLGSSEGKLIKCTMCENHGEDVLFSQEHKFRCKYFKCMCRLCRGVRTRFKAHMQNKTLCPLCERHQVFTFDDNVHLKLCRFRGCRCHLCQAASPPHRLGLVASYGSDGDSRDGLEGPLSRKGRDSPDPGEAEPPPPGVDEEPPGPLVTLPGMDKYRDVTPSPSPDADEDVAPTEVDATNKVASSATNQGEGIGSEATPPTKSDPGERNSSAGPFSGLEETVDAISEFLRNSDSGPMSPSPTTAAHHNEDTDDTLENIDLEALLDDLMEEDAPAEEHTSPNVSSQASPSISRTKSETTPSLPSLKTTMPSTPLRSSSQRSLEPMLGKPSEDSPSSDNSYRLRLTPSPDERHSGTESLHQSHGGASSNLVVFELEASLDDDDEEDLDLDDTLSDRLVIDLDAASDLTVTPAGTPTPLDDAARVSPSRMIPDPTTKTESSAVTAEAKTEPGGTAQTSPANQRYCAFCRNHGKLRVLKGHKTSCEYRQKCKCPPCEKRSQQNQRLASGQPSPRGRGRPRIRDVGFGGIPRTVESSQVHLGDQISQEAKIKVEDYGVTPVSVKLEEINSVLVKQDESNAKTKDPEDIPLIFRLQSSINEKIKKLGIKPLSDNLDVKPTESMKLEDKPLYVRLQEFRMKSKDNAKPGPLCSKLLKKTIKKKKIKSSPADKSQKEVKSQPLVGIPSDQIAKVCSEVQSQALYKETKVMSSNNAKEDKFKCETLNESKLVSAKVDECMEPLKKIKVSPESGTKSTKFQVITILNNTVIGKVTVRNEAEMLATPEDFSEPKMLEKVSNNISALPLEHTHSLSQLEHLAVSPPSVQSSPQALLRKQATPTTPTSPMDLSVARSSQYTLRSPEVTVLSPPDAKPRLPLKLKLKLTASPSSSPQDRSSPSSTTSAPKVYCVVPSASAPSPSEPEPQAIPACVSAPPAFPPSAKVPQSIPPSANAPQSLPPFSNAPQSLPPFSNAPQSLPPSANVPQPFPTCSNVRQAHIPSSNVHQPFPPSSNASHAFPAATNSHQPLATSASPNFTGSASLPQAYKPSTSAPPAYFSSPVSQVPPGRATASSAPPCFGPAPSATARLSACEAESALPELVDLEDVLGVGDGTLAAAAKPVPAPSTVAAGTWKVPAAPVPQVAARRAQQLASWGSVKKSADPMASLARMAASWGGSAAVVPSIPASPVGPGPPTFRAPAAPAPARPWESTSVIINKTHPCGDCGLRQPSALAAARHRVDHHTACTRRECDKCSGVSWSKLQSDVHQALAHPPGVQHRCPVCAACFPSDVMLTTHLLTMKDPPHVDMRSSLPAEQAKLTCPICWRFRAKDPKVLGSHVRLEHANCTPFACDEPGCSLAFDAPLALQTHRQRHNLDNAQERCLACCVPFVTRELLNDHWRQKHSGVSPFACPLCSKSFRAPAGLTQHIRRQHPGSTPFRCREEGCNRSFPCVALLHEHACESRHMSLPAPSHLFTQPKLWQPQLDPVSSAATSTPSTCSVCPASLPDEWSLIDHQDVEHMNLVPIARATQLLSLTRDAELLRPRQGYFPPSPYASDSVTTSRAPYSTAQTSVQPQVQPQITPHYSSQSQDPSQPQIPPHYPSQPQIPPHYPSQPQTQLPSFTNRPVFAQPPQTFVQSTSYVQTASFVQPPLYSEFKQT
ncbi:uncharacterized protein LOC113208686 isoform X2 [Frankliniella occidentalis]|uniref:Uncharacterized protein LOC113208686 isoform X2 n=1 Tax=Frankliniella occidentalis TaxID=133901 RepID=A0A9C6U389_FRAOC|nr:uncharacterized protein LOC113208686 isoform X2 [Frankliniella occidentalis]